MNPSKYNDHYKKFPYKKEYENGRVNNGGMDLINNPELISKITEARNFPELFIFLTELNYEKSQYLTLGCLADFDENNVFFGYVEFSFRDKELSQDEAIISKIDDMFYIWVQEKHREQYEHVKLSLFWEYFQISYHGEYEKFVVSVYYRSLTQESAGQLLNLIREFLLNDYSIYIKLL